MSVFLTVLVNGIVIASLYLIFGLGLAIVYRATGVLNFAHGAVGSVAGYVAYSLLGHDMPYALAALIAIAAGAALSAALYLLVVDRLPATSTESVGILTLGLAIVIQAILLAIYGGEAVALPQPVHSSTLFTIGSYSLQAPNLLALGVAVAVTALVSWGLYRTKPGLSVRAVSEGSVTSSMFGINGTLARTAVWGIAGALAGITALLVTPTAYLTPDFLTTYLIVAFTAVVLGGFERIAGVAVGALIFGIAQSMVATYITNRLTQTVSFATILAVLVFLPYGLFGSTLPRVPEPHLPRRRYRPAWARGLSRLSRKTRIVLAVSAPPPLRLSLLLLAVTTAVFLAFGDRFNTPHQLLITTIAAMVIAVIGTNIIFGLSGQLSIGQSGFMLLGGYTTVLLQTRADVPFLIALCAAGLVAGVSGAIFGLPAARLRGVYLAVLTLAFALAIPEVARYFTALTGGDNGIPAPLPSWLGRGVDRNLHIYWFSVGLAAVALATSLLTSHSALVRSWKALRDSEHAAAASGVRVVRQRVLAFAIGSALCGLSGAVIASNTGYLTPGTFTVWDSIYLIVAVVVGGRASSLGALLGSIFIVGVPYFASGVQYAPGVILGLAVIAVLLLRPEGTQALFTRGLYRPLAARLARRRAPSGGPPGGGSESSPGGTPALASMVAGRKSE